MFHLTNLEVTAGTSTPFREAITKMAAKTGLMDEAVRFTKDTREPELGATYLVIALSELASKRNAPPSLLSALSDLLSEAVATIQTHYKTNPVVASTLLTSAMGVQAELPSAAAGSKSEPPSRVAPGVGTGDVGETIEEADIGGSEMGEVSIVFMGEMPHRDVNTCAGKIGSDESIAVYYYENPRTIGSVEAGIEPIFEYPQVAVIYEQSRPVFIVRTEKSSMESSILCGVDTKGVHMNFGSFGPTSRDDFMRKAIEVFRNIRQG